MARHAGLAHPDRTLGRQQHGHQEGVGEPRRRLRPQQDAQPQDQPRHPLEHADPHHPWFLAPQRFRARGHEQLRSMGRHQIGGGNEADQDPRVGEVAGVERQDRGDEYETAGQRDERQVARR